MKAKHKTSEQIYHQIIPMPYTHLVNLIVENDSYLDNIESKIVSFQATSAEIELSFTRNGVKTAVQKVMIAQHDHLASHVTVYPVYSESQQPSWFFPLAFLLLFFLLVNLAIRSTGLSIVVMLTALSVFTYIGVRYLEENSGKLIEYDEEDGKLNSRPITSFYLRHSYGYQLRLKPWNFGEQTHVALHQVDYHHKQIDYDWIRLILRAALLTIVVGLGILLAAGSAPLPMLIVILLAILLLMFSFNNRNNIGKLAHNPKLESLILEQIQAELGEAPDDNILDEEDEKKTMLE